MTASEHLDLLSREARGGRQERGERPERGERQERGGRGRGRGGDRQPPRDQSPSVSDEDNPPGEHVRHGKRRGPNDTRRRRQSMLQAAERAANPPVEVDAAAQQDTTTAAPTHAETQASSITAPEPVMANAPATGRSEAIGQAETEQDNQTGSATSEVVNVETAVTTVPTEPAISTDGQEVRRATNDPRELRRQRALSNTGSTSNEQSVSAEDVQER